MKNWNMPKVLGGYGAIGIAMWQVMASDMPDIYQGVCMVCLSALWVVLQALILYSPPPNKQGSKDE